MMPLDSLGLDNRVYGEKKSELFHRDVLKVADVFVREIFRGTEEDRGQS